MLKTFTFAVMHFSVAFLVVYALTGSFLIGGTVALIEPTVNTVGFYFHELIWRRIEGNQNIDSETSLMA